jgi:hypothetical protein
MVLRISPLPPFHWMSIVEPNQAFSVRSVERKGVVDTVRLLGRYRYARHHELNPVAARRIDDEGLPVEV